MPQDKPQDKTSSLKPGALPVPPPARGAGAENKPGIPDLRIEEIEERHIPKDRNIFDK